MRKISTVLLLLLPFFLSGRLAADDHTGHNSSEFNLEEVLVHHLMDSPIFELNIGGEKVRPGDPAFENDPYRRYIFKDEQGIYKWQGGIPLHITKRVAMMWVVSILMVLVFVAGARKIAKDPARVQGRFAGLVEVLVNFVRHDIAEENMHHPSQGFLAYVITAFFFILFSNLLGLFPPVGEIIEITKNLVTGHPIAHHGGPGELPSPVIAIWPGITVTGDIAVTFTLAAMTVIMIYAAGFKYQGVQFVWHAVPGGVPLWLYPIMWPIEFIIGPLAKGFALMIRLLANMTAGHVIILVLAGFIFQYRSWGLVPVSITGMGAIYLLELMVAFLQAFIFTLLSSIFIGLSMHRH
jgi:F-type H+-transporting ATPase subunit a